MNRLGLALIWYSVLLLHELSFVYRLVKSFIRILCMKNTSFGCDLNWLLVYDTNIVESLFELPVGPRASL